MKYDAMYQPKHGGAVCNMQHGGAVCNMQTHDQASQGTQVSPQTPTPRPPTPHLSLISVFRFLMPSPPLSPTDPVPRAY